MKEYVYETITHLVDLYQEMEQLNQSVTNIESKTKDEKLGFRELLDLGNDNWAIYSSINYFENIKLAMQTNYTRNWMRLIYVKNGEEDMGVDVEISLANHDKLVNGKSSFSKPSKAKL